MLYWLLFILFTFPSVAQFGQRSPFGGFPQQTAPDTEVTEGVESDEPDSGNWYEKLRLWKEARKLYTGDVSDAMEHVKSIKIDYESKKNLLLKQITAYFKSLPVDRAGALTLIKSHIDELTKIQEQTADAQTSEQKAEAARIADQIKLLESLKTDFEHLITLDQRLTQAFNEIAIKQIKECQRYDERALDSFERIEKVLDDEKAVEYYGIIENSLENIRAIITYLIGPLQQFLDQTWALMQHLMPKIKKSIEDLDRQGIHIRELTEQEKAEEAARAKQREEARLKALAAKKAEEARKAMSWWQRIFAAIGGFFSSIFGGIKSVFTSIGGLFTRTQPVKQVPAKPPVPVPPVKH